MKPEPKPKSLSDIIREWNEIRRQYTDDRQFLKLWHSIEVPTETKKGAA